MQSHTGSIASRSFNPQGDAKQMFSQCNYSCQQTRQAIERLTKKMKALHGEINIKGIQDTETAKVQLQTITKLSHAIENSMREVKAFTGISINYLNKVEKWLPACVDGFDLDNDKVREVDKFVADICGNHSDAVIRRKLALLQLREKLLNKLSSLKDESVTLQDFYQRLKLQSKASEVQLTHYLQKNVR